MPGLPATPSGVIAVDHRFTIGADTNVNTKLHFRYTGGPPAQTDLNALATSVGTSFSSHLATWFAPGVVLNEVWIADLANPANPIGIASPNVAGTLTTQTQLPASICVVAAYHIARRYRGGHPRGYWPAFGNANQQGLGTWQTASINSFVTALQAHIAAISALTQTIAVGAQCSVSYYSGSTPETTASGKTKYKATPRATPLIDTVSAVSASTRMGSQRRRLKKA